MFEYKEYSNDGDYKESFLRKTFCKNNRIINTIETDAIVNICQKNNNF